jgi:hypothetical protein
MEMKKLTATIVAMTALFLANAPTANAGWFFLTEKVTSRGSSLATSSVYSTQAACVTKSEAGGIIVIQGCVSSCDPANAKSQYFLEQEVNGRFTGFGPYGYEADCEAGSESAAAAAIPGVTIMATCTFVAAKRACQ